jgi:hypothetical protein
MKQHLTMQQLEDLGFKITKSYIHDNFMTQRRKKGLIEVETTWKKTGEFESQDLTIEEINCQTFTPIEIKQLDLILNKYR